MQRRNLVWGKGERVKVKGFFLSLFPFPFSHFPFSPSPTSMGVWGCTVFLFTIGITSDLSELLPEKPQP
ncbi:hypothetical protein NIES2107_45300 [Nostoc carneum NIES-2107]|nr:hypothetical protein NIES2107_45300 [Nostoc carneum NIES-2107]